MNRYLKIIVVLFLLHPVCLDAQQNAGRKQAISQEEQWERDSIEFAEKFQRKWIQDSTQWAKVYNERKNPKDSLSYIDKKVKALFASESITSLDSVLALINSNFKTALHKTRAIYFWIGTNIRYDSISYLSNSITFYHELEKDAKYTFNRKAGVCSQYASLFQYMAKYCGIEAETVVGYTKQLPFKYVPTETNHAWNVVKIKGKWILVDPTWGRLNQEEVESFWFNTPPDLFIYSHYPEKTDYQLLNRPILISTFRNLPIVSTNFFLSKIPFNVPSLGYFSNNNGLLEIEAANTKKDYVLKFTAYPVSSDSSPEFSSYETWIEVPYNVRASSNKGFSIIETQTPGKGSWWIKLDIIENIRIGDNKHSIPFSNSLMFQVSKI